MAQPQRPVVNAGEKYVNGLGLTYVSATTLSVAAGACRDSSNTNDIVLSAAVTVNTALQGANGLDIGVLQSVRIYAVYVIADSTKYQPTAVILSLNASAPLLPTGYDMYRRIGWVKSNAVPALEPWQQFGDGNTRTYFYDTPIEVLLAGDETSFTAVDLDLVIPRIDSLVTVDVSFAAAGASNVLEFRDLNSAAPTIGCVRFGTGVAATQVGSLVVPSSLNAGLPSLIYKVSAGTVTLQVSGYQDYLS